MMNVLCPKWIVIVEVGWSVFETLYSVFSLVKSVALSNCNTFLISSLVNLYVDGLNAGL